MNEDDNKISRFMQLTYGLFTNLNGSYVHFSNKAASEASAMYKMLNIENLHNHVHELIAGESIVPKAICCGTLTDQGHMGTDYAAFDPIFWLHHA